MAQLCIGGGNGRPEISVQLAGCKGIMPKHVALAHLTESDFDTPPPLEEEDEEDSGVFTVDFRRHTGASKRRRMHPARNS